VNKPNAFFEFFWWLLAVECGHDTTAASVDGEEEAKMALLKLRLCKGLESRTSLELVCPTRLSLYREKGSQRGGMESS